MMNVRMLGKILSRLIKPLMNQRGAVGDQDAPADGIARDENGFIPGTTFKTVEELAKGFQETKADHGRISNEYGTLKKDHEGLKSQAQTLAETLKETLGKKEPAEKANGIDYDSEIQNVIAQVEKLDPMKDSYQSELAKLLLKSNQITAERTKNAVLGEAGKLFQKELHERDVKTSQKEFLKANPTFNTPEMQARIKDFIANDSTGMHDNMSAFFQIQRDDALTQANDLSAKNAEMMKVLDLQKGKDSTGKVIVKGQSPGQVTNKPKLTGEARNAAMAEALAKLE